MQKRIDREPFAFIAVASGIITFGSPVVKSIGFLGGQIYSTVRNYGSNEKDCLDLAAHVNEVIHYLQYLEPNKQLDGQLEESLQHLETCLTECWQFLQKYIDASFFGHVIRSHHYKRKFEELNKQLVSCKERLVFGLNIQKSQANVQAQRHLTTASTADQQRRRKHLVHPPRKHLAPPNDHFMKQVSANSPHQNRRMHHSNSAANLLPNRVINHHASNGKLHH